MTGIDTFFSSSNGTYSTVAATQFGTITKGSATQMNHFKVQVSQNRIDVFGSDAGSVTLKHLAGANLALTFSQGLVWLNDVHYNARKAIEPCECGTQFDHSFTWDNLGFDGPKTYRDLGFDVADSNTVGQAASAGDPSRRVGYQVGLGTMTLTTDPVRRDQTPTGALLVLNSYSFVKQIPSVSINGGPWIDTPWPFTDAQTYSWRSLAIPIPLDQVHDGANTIAFKSGDASTLVSNISIILVAGSPVP